MTTKTAYLVVVKSREVSFRTLQEAKIVAIANRANVWRDNGQGTVELVWNAK